MVGKAPNNEKYEGVRWLTCDPSQDTFHELPQSLLNSQRPSVSCVNKVLVVVIAVQKNKNTKECYMLQVRGIPLGNKVSGTQKARS